MRRIGIKDNDRIRIHGQMIPDSNGRNYEPLSIFSEQHVNAGPTKEQLTKTIRPNVDAVEASISEKAIYENTESNLKVTESCSAEYQRLQQTHKRRI